MLGFKLNYNDLLVPLSHDITVAALQPGRYSRGPEGSLLRVGIGLFRA